MLKKLGGYFLLSFFSFCFFTVVFHTVASAQTGAALPIQPPTSTPAPLPTVIPTPTAFSTNTPTPTLQPTQAVLEAKTSVIQDTPTPTVPITPTTTPTTVMTPIPTSTPTPTPTITPTTTDLASLFSKYSGQYSVDQNELMKIAKCESGFTITSTSSNGLYVGMYQFSRQSWMSVRTEMNMDPNPDLRTNADEAIKTAAFMLSKGRQQAWPNCN